MFERSYPFQLQEERVKLRIIRFTLPYPRSISLKKFLTYLKYESTLATKQEQIR